MCYKCYIIDGKIILNMIITTFVHDFLPMMNFDAEFLIWLLGNVQDPNIL